METQLWQLTLATFALFATFVSGGALGFYYAQISSKRTRRGELVRRTTRREGIIQFSDQEERIVTDASDQRRIEGSLSSDSP
jgi:hypothetical protein